MKLSDRELEELEQLFRRLSSGELSEVEFNLKRASLLRGASGASMPSGKGRAAEDWRTGEEPEARPPASRENEISAGRASVKVIDYDADGSSAPHTANFARVILEAPTEHLRTKSPIPAMQLLVLVGLLVCGILLIIAQTGHYAVPGLPQRSAPATMPAQMLPLPPPEPITLVDPAQYRIAPLFGPDAVNRCIAQCSGQEGCAKRCALADAAFFARQIRAVDLTPDGFESLVRNDCRKSTEGARPAADLEHFLKTSRSAVSQLAAVKAPSQPTAERLLGLHREFASLNAQVVTAPGEDRFQTALHVSEAACLRSYLYLTHFAALQAEIAGDTLSRRRYLRLRARIVPAIAREADGLAQAAAASLRTVIASRDLTDTFPPPPVKPLLKIPRGEPDPAALPFRIWVGGSAWAPAYKPLDETLYVCRSSIGTFSCSYLDYEELRMQTELEKRTRNANLQLIAFQQGFWLRADTVGGYFEICRTSLGDFYCNESDKRLHSEALP